MPVLSLACHLPHNASHIPWRYNYEQTTKQTKAINNSYIYINISCKCDTNRAGHLTLDAYASRPVACGWTVRLPSWVRKIGECKLCVFGRKMTILLWGLAVLWNQGPFFLPAVSKVSAVCATDALDLSTRPSISTVMNNIPCAGHVSTFIRYNIWKKKIDCEKSPSLFKG